MEIELKNIKYVAALSEETHCFTASLYIDGKKRGEVSNRGHGGCNEYTDPTAEDEINAYAKTLPKKWAFEQWFDQDAEILICNLINDYLDRKQLQKELKAVVLTIKDGSLWQYKLKSGKREELIEHLKRRGEQVLNALPFDAAFSLYVKTTKEV